MRSVVMKIRKWYVPAFLLVVLALFVGVGFVTAATSPEIDWYVIGAGGGSDSAGGYTLKATIGQPLTGLNSADSVDLCSGFWCKVLEIFDTFLPTLFR
jgi:hypothetical protein